MHARQGLCGPARAFSYKRGVVLKFGRRKATLGGLPTQAIGVYAQGTHFASPAVQDAS